MRIAVLKKIVVSFTFLFLSMLAATHAGAASPSLLQAKKAAEDKGYIFFASHAEIVAGAKKEGKLRVRPDLEPPNFQPLINGFKQRYPFITDIHVEEIHGSPEAHQKVLLEIKSGQAKGSDITFAYLDFIDEYIPYLMKHDIVGMAKHGVLKIDPRMVHPGEKNMVSVTSSLTVVPYNRKLISEDKVPAKWEDFLKPEFKGKKFVLDARPVQVAGLVPAWGLERTLDFARKLAAQQPVWGRGATRVTTAVAVGEYSLYVGSNFGSIHRVMRKDPTGNLNYKIIEPAPVRVVNGAIGILNTADHPYAALLWLEFLASPEGQEIIDKYEPLRGSVFSPGSAIAQVTRGKELSVVGWDHVTKFDEYLAQIVKAFGFPKVDK
ncbi:MAG: extracellular solute-binding protein [Deltaproteobacteria bacterium]|nr:extracellular solute-binding protein [Deltaproteobacteria bacterium]